MLLTILWSQRAQDVWFPGFFPVAGNLKLVRRGRAEELLTSDIMSVIMYLNRFYSAKKYEYPVGPRAIGYVTQQGGMQRLVDFARACERALDRYLYEYR